MKLTEKLKNSFKDIITSVLRYPLAVIFFISAAFVNAMEINNRIDDFQKYILTFAVGAFLSIVSQMIYERFFKKQIHRILLKTGALVLTAGYYTIINLPSELSMQITIKTMVAIFALFFAFIWVPVIKSRISFNESFLAAFKSFFISLFFSLIIYIGISAIIGATDKLLFSVNSKAYAHGGNIIFVIFAPIYFLSLMPFYPGIKDKDKSKEEITVIENEINKIVSYPKYLEILISYIIMPLASVFTLILLLYILRNLRADFWTNNLLEPMLVSYSIVVIIICLLASRLKNNFAVIFMKIFPKILIPIVFFQILSSILRIKDSGITHGRYYVIMYGIFALISGIVFSVKPIEKNGLIAIFLIIFSTVSIVPPIDAFTVSRTNQINMLENVIIKNNMLKNEKITPNPSLSESDRKKIIYSTNYLNRMNYIKDIKWFPQGFNYYNDFESVFGFKEYEILSTDEKYVYIMRDTTEAIDVSGYDTLLYVNISSYNRGGGVFNNVNFKNNEKTYTLKRTLANDYYTLEVVNENNEVIISYDLKEIFDKFQNYSNKEQVPLDEVTFIKENEKAGLKIVLQFLDISRNQSELYYGSDLNILINIK